MVAEDKEGQKRKSRLSVHYDCMTGFIGQKSDAEDFVRLCALLRINVHLCATLAKFDHCCATLSDFVHSRALSIDFVRLCAGRP